MTVVTLTPRLTASDEVRNSVIGLLKRALAQAEAGDIDTVILISSHPNGEWSDLTSETIKFSEAIGRLEITKQEWISNYLEGREKENQA